MEAVRPNQPTDWPKQTMLVQQDRILLFMAPPRAPPPPQRTLHHPAQLACTVIAKMKESTRLAIQECLEQHRKDYVDLTRAESTTSPLVHSLGRMIGCLEVDLFNYMNGAVNLY